MKMTHLYYVCYPVTFRHISPPCSLHQIRCSSMKNRRKIRANLVLLLTQIFKSSLTMISFRRNHFSATVYCLATCVRFAHNLHNQQMWGQVFIQDLTPQLQNGVCWAEALRLLVFNVHICRLFFVRFEKNSGPKKTQVFPKKLRFLPIFKKLRSKTAIFSLFYLIRLQKNSGPTAKNSGFD